MEGEDATSEGLEVDGGNKTDFRTVTPGEAQGSSRQNGLVSLLAKIDCLLAEEKLFAAARLLRTLDPVPPRFIHVVRKAEDCEQAVSDLVQDPDSDWIQQGESHGDRDALVYYKLEGDARLTCRIESPVETSLLIPLLSVLNEVELYPDWIPSWTIPRIGVQESKQLEQQSKASQIVQVRCYVPWPFADREVVMQVTGVDEIDDNGFIAVRLQSLPTGGVVPPPDANAERVDFAGALLFRACPVDHPLYGRAREKHGDQLMLVSFKMFVDAKMAGVPTGIVNFVTRTVIGHIWAMLLSVASEVCDQKRPRHQDMIRRKVVFYEWMGRRIGALMQKIEDEIADLEANQKFISYLQG